MAAAVLPPNHNIGLSSTSNASPTMDSKAGVKQQGKSDPKSKPSSPTQTKTSLQANQPQTQPEDSKSAPQVSEPLAPPPRPAASNPAADTPDYFSSLHNNTGISGEFNPFEQSFGAPSAETPGGTRLPPVAALTSPVPGASTNGGYNWNNSLRSGPLSPAMLEGPAGGDYFGNISSRGFPTPNESSLRTGLTPGGGGSMFPAPSPNSQALFNSLASGGATPGTLDFHRTAMNAAARNKNGTTQFPATSAAAQNNSSMDAQHDATDAANGLFMLAKGGQANQFAVPNQPVQPPMQTRAQDNKRNGRQNNGSIDSVSGPEANENSESQEDTKSTARSGKAKKNAKAEATTNGRRKSEATAKGSNKRAKGNNGNANVDPALDPNDDDMDEDMNESDMDDDTQDGKDPKKMTDEEKRRNFLERNRVAALKCRQRKKQWLANLQAKVEMFSAENESLNTQVAQLHDEIRNLRTLLMGHKDCPVGHAQGIGQFLNGMQDPSGFGGQHVNPYGMAMQPGMQRT